MSAHMAYVAASYAAAALVIAGLIGWVAVDAHLRRRELKALEAAGIRRRSSAKAPS